AGMDFFGDRVAREGQPQRCEWRPTARAGREPLGVNEFCGKKIVQLPFQSPGNGSQSGIPTGGGWVKWMVPSVGDRPIIV
ncbi:MAG: hypothetical protein ACYC4U_24450, partial [Pirellulaceae bacterium]